ncbi:CFF_collapsed_G0052220.mRNA.1.CDS.1 [Saccharomyces cerevisiae]|nr:AIG_G0050640.mRNA.1.CDS.1 [Saccharomyces cerevisiae]CAI5321471.1 CFF_HP2_G0045020.mRNA.1.CDS.1 [Saccharomyces cerevisiae]CAI6734369.1 CFF_HP2_G0045020.mRNA.1.CDS.1 [Saccharomyces cerevisiae]CAI6752090.1 CFF_HP1_G0047230.mRNA.1.CDS.1 [Saccharomyces cerevisiae]CAI6887483.1 AIG_G0050640.mRNA.1.CDS.1 [Saccharomyces cerevisiae]
MYNPVDAVLTKIITNYGIDSFTLRYAICLLGSFPLNAILKRIPEKRIGLKCCFIISMSMFYLFGVLNLVSGFRTLFISTMFTYLISRFYRSKFMPHLNFMFVMGHLAINHIHAQFLNEQTQTTVDITSSQMVLAMKLTSFAWSYYDGSCTSESDFKDLTEHQKSRAVRGHPPLLKFLAYAFFYSTLLTGPSFDYADFDSWLNCEMFRDLPESKKPMRRHHPGERRQIPKNGKLALWKVVQGLAWMILSTLGMKHFPVKYVLDKDGFPTRSFIFRIHYLFLLGFIHRFKYYAAWTISEGSCILCGLGYNGYDSKTQKIRWDRVRNIDIWTVETAQNTREMLEAWNMNTNKWLKYSVYLRVTKKGKKPGFRSTLFTFLTSAFWHGTRPGYYLTFATGALYQTCGKIYRRNFRPIFLREDGVTPLPSKKIYDLVGIYAIKLAFGYMVQPFIILDLKPSLMVWGSVYFYVHIIVAFSFFLFRGPYAKQVTEFFKSKQPKEILIRKQKKLEKDISASSPNLGGILKAKIEHEKGKTAEEEEMNLGIPPIELEKWDNAKEDWEDFCKDYKEWRNKNGLEIEEENLSKAFERFKEEFSNAASGSGERVRKMSFSGYSPKPISKKEE